MILKLGDWRKRRRREGPINPLSLVRERDPLLAAKIESIGCRGHVRFLLNARKLIILTKIGPDTRV